MARVRTGKEVHGVVDEGRTGRIIARRVLRRGLGNPKARVKNLREFGLEMYIKGIQFGEEYMRGRIHNSVAGLSYGPGYYVAPTVEEQSDADVLVRADEDVRSDSGVRVMVADSPAVDDDAWSRAAKCVQEYPDAERIPARTGHGHDPEAGDFPSS